MPKSYYWCLSQPFKDLLGTKMDNCILLFLPARGWVSLTMLKLIANFGGSKCPPAGNHGWRDRIYISVQSPACEWRSVTFSHSKLDIHKFTAARCTLLFWSMESIAVREGVERGFLKKGVFFTMERNPWCVISGCRWFPALAPFVQYRSQGSERNWNTGWGLLSNFVLLCITSHPNFARLCEQRRHVEAK